MFPSVSKDLKMHFTQIVPTNGPFSSGLQKSYPESRRSILFMFPRVLEDLKIHFSQVAPTKVPFRADSTNSI